MKAVPVHEKSTWKVEIISKVKKGRDLYLRDRQ